MPRHAGANRLQTRLLILTLLGTMASWLTLRLYRARPIPPAAAPELWRILQVLALRAELPTMPTLHYVPSPIINAFAVASCCPAGVIQTPPGCAATPPPRNASGACWPWGHRAPCKPCSIFGLTREIGESLNFQRLRIPRRTGDSGDSGGERAGMKSRTVPQVTQSPARVADRISRNRGFAPRQQCRPDSKRFHFVDHQ